MFHKCCCHSFLFLLEPEIPSTIGAGQQLQLLLFSNFFNIFMGYSNFWARKCSCEDFEPKEEDGKEEEDDETEEVDEKEKRKLYHNLYSAPSAI